MLRLEKKDKAYLAGGLLLLVRSFVYEPYQKAKVDWVPPDWLLSAASILTLAAFLVIAVAFFLPHKK